jgi:hypothetical protein
MKYEDVVKSTPTISFSSSKQNDMNTYSSANITVARLPGSVEQSFTINFGTTGSFIVKPLILHEWVQHILDGSLPGVELEEHL